MGSYDNVVLVPCTLFSVNEIMVHAVGTNHMARTGQENTNPQSMWLRSECSLIGKYCGRIIPRINFENIFELCTTLLSA